MIKFIETNGTPGNCNGNPTEGNRTAINNTCGPGWEPIPIEDEDPYDPNNDLALPCEIPVDYSNFDSLVVHNQSIREAFNYILPPEYAPFIQFNQNGTLDTTVFLSAQYSYGIPSSNLYNALVACLNSGFNIDLYLRSTWRGIVMPDSTLKFYSWNSLQQNIYGITVMPGDIPTVTGVPVTGNPTSSWIFIKKGEESSIKRLAFIVVHELLGHLYSFINNDPYIHGNSQFEIWINKVESEAQKNWRMIKKWEKSNLSCF